MLQRIEAQRKSFKQNKGIEIIAFKKAQALNDLQACLLLQTEFEAIQRFVKPQRHLIRHSYALFRPIASLLHWLQSNRSDSPLLKIWSNFRSSRPKKKPNNLPICPKKDISVVCHRFRRSFLPNLTTANHYNSSYSYFAPSSI